MSNWSCEGLKCNMSILTNMRHFGELLKVSKESLALRTNTLFTPAPKRDRSFYLSIYLSKESNNYEM